MRKVLSILNRTVIRRMIAGGVILITLIALAGVPIYVMPRTDALQRADAVLVLGGYGYIRNRIGLQLGADGLAPTVVISNPNGVRDQFMTNLCTKPQQGFRLLCFVPDPATTKGEGREFNRLATEMGWKSAIVVTSTPHVTRARYILSQCFPGRITMVESPAPIPIIRWPYEYLYQTAAFGRAVLNPGC